MEGQKLYDICVVGSGCVDHFMEVADFPKKGETISAKTFFNSPGGKGANQAVAASRLLGQVLFAGQFGTDDYGHRIEKEMEEAGVNMQYLRKLSDVKTGLSFITLNDHGDNAIIIIGGANTHYEDLSILPKEYKEAVDRSRIILLQREIPEEINTLVAKYAHSKGKLVALDVGGRDEPFTHELLSHIDYISPNETELSRLIDYKSLENIEEVIRSQLLSKYPNLKVVLKLGENGCAVVTKELYLKCNNITTFNNNILNDYAIIDVTGAGDCFMGAFFVKYLQLIGTLSQEEVYKRSMLFGNLCAFLCITKKGAAPVMPEAKVVKEFQQKYLQGLDI